MVILVGIAGSGKTTWCTKHLPCHVRISLDDIKNHNRKMEDKMIEHELEKENNIVIDDTNLTKDIRKKHITVAKRYHAHVNAICFCIDMQRAYEQNSQRKKKIPYFVLNNQQKQLAIPVREEGFDFVQILRV